MGELPADIARACAGVQIIRHTVFLAATDSTQTQARRLAAQHGPGVLIVADTQRAGRGRSGKAWFSPPGLGLYLTLVLSPRRPPQDWPLATSLASLALREALAETAGLICGIKWPNDLLCRGRKLAGILAERSSDGPLLLGMGVNLLHRSEDFPAELRAAATSVWIELEHAGNRLAADGPDAALAASLAPERSRAPSSALPDREAVLGATLRALERRLETFEEAGPSALLPGLRAASLLLGRTVEVALGGNDTLAEPGPDARTGEVLRGRMVDLGARGELILMIDEASGPRQRIVTAGEVRKIEPPLDR
jgi:biotin-(acetyl-CoA carboxylase) ligase